MDGCGNFRYWSIRIHQFNSLRVSTALTVVRKINEAVDLTSFLKCIIYKKFFLDKQFRTLDILIVFLIPHWVSKTMGPTVCFVVEHHKVV